MPFFKVGREGNQLFCSTRIFFPFVTKQPINSGEYWIL